MTGGTLLLSALVLLLAVAFGVMLMRVLYEPFDRLFQKIVSTSEKPMSPNRITYLANIFDRLRGENDDLRIAARRNLPILRDKILMQWVMQSVPPRADANYIQGMGIELGYPLNRIVVLCYETQSSETNLVELIRSEIFTEFWNGQLSLLGNHYMVQFQPQRFFVILNYLAEHEPLDGWENWFNERFHIFRHEFECIVTGGISPPKQSMEELNVAFTEAYESAETQLVMGSGYMRSFHANTSRNLVAYPFKLMDRLVSALSSCDDTSMIEAMKSIEVFFEDHPPASRFALHNIYLSMIQTLYNALEPMVGQSLSQDCRIFTDKLLSAETLREYSEVFKAFVKAMRKACGSYMSQRDALLVEEIKSYIEENYQTDITPYLLTERFRISTTYLYSIMKELAGTSPLHYLTHVRMERSAQLLEKTDLNVRQIALQCGIDSEQRFYRNFKKHFGCTPLCYRKNRRTD